MEPQQQHPLVAEVRQEWRRFLAADFTAYAQYVHGLRPAAFQERWARAMADPGNHRLVVVAPPESGKTAWCIAYCCWLIGRDPSVHIGYVGNTAAQALRQSVAVRDTVRWNPKFRQVFPKVALDEAKGTSEREWFVRRPDPGDKDATFVVSGFRGPLLGARLDVAVLDDYSDQENTASPEQQERAWAWLQQNVVTRLNPDRGRLICIQTRWAQGDVVGRLEEVGAEMLQFAALTADGAPLWPERWRRAGLEKRRREMGSRLFDLHYMGVIVSKDGEVFRPQWWSYWDASLDGRVAGEVARPKADRVVLSLDTASKTGLSNDYSAATVWAFRNAGSGRGEAFAPASSHHPQRMLRPVPTDHRSPLTVHYLLHAWRGKVEFPELLRTVEAMAREWKADYVLIEDKGAGQALVQELRQRGIYVTPVVPTADKLTRAIGVTAIVERGQVFLPRHAGWLNDFRYELETFPRARHDDWVDSTVQYLEWASTATGFDLRIWF